jgi:pentacotripeptide repeat protein
MTGDRLSRPGASSLGRPKSTGATTLGRLLGQVVRVASARDVTFRGLTEAAGLDPKRDFAGISLNGLPLEQEDVSGFDFSGSDLRGTGVERARGLDGCRFAGAVFDGPSLDPEVWAFNKRLNRAEFRESEGLLRDAVARSSIRYDVVSYTTLIRRSPTQERAAHWYEEMRAAGVAPNVVTFNTLIGKSGSEERAAHWYEEMRAAGVAPDVFTFSTLIGKSGNEERATPPKTEEPDAQA